MGYRKDLISGGLIGSSVGREGLKILIQRKEKWQSDSQILGDGNFVPTLLKENEEKWAKKSYYPKDGIYKH